MSLNLNVSKVETGNIVGESSQTIGQEKSLISVVGQEALAQQQEKTPIELTAEVILANQLDEVRKRKDLEYKKEQFVQILTPFLEKENDIEMGDLINKMIDIIKNSTTCDPEEIKYAFADYLSSQAFLSSVGDRSIVGIKDFLKKNELGELKEPLIMACLLAQFCVANDSSNLNYKFSFNDLKYIADAGKPHKVLTFMTNNNYIKKNTEFRDFAVKLIDIAKIKKDQYSHSALCLIAETYAEEGNVELTIEYIKLLITGYTFLHYENTIFSIITKFLNSEKISLEDRKAQAAAFLAALLPTPSPRPPIRDSEEVTSSGPSLEGMPQELHDRILGYADTNTLGRLAQTNIKEAHLAYIEEKKRILLLLQLFCVFFDQNSVHRQQKEFYKFNDLLTKLNNTAACNLDDVKYIAVKYLLKSDHLSALRDATKIIECRRFNNIIELAKSIKEKKISTTLEPSIADFQFLLSKYYDEDDILKFLVETNLIERKVFREFLPTLLPTPSSLPIIGTSSQTNQEEISSASSLLESLAQNNVEEARKEVYIFEKARICELIQSICVFFQEHSEGAESRIIYALNDLIIKLEKMDRCDLDSVKYILVEYLMRTKTENLDLLKKNIELDNAGRFQNIIELALAIKEHKIPETSKFSEADLKFLTAYFRI